MKKILVHVGVPVISGSYDILLPETCRSGN